MLIYNQASVSYSNDQYRQNILYLSTDLVWKNYKLAGESETTDLNAAYRTELFMLANRELLNFEVVKSFPRVIFSNLGCTDREIEIYSGDKTRIPEPMKDIVVQEYQKALTSINVTTGRYAYWDIKNQRYTTVYEEVNNYYRMLAGLPDVDDQDYIYNSDARWTTGIPIHEMPLIELYKMESEGLIADLMTQFPDKKYLRYIGRRRIDFYVARAADRFDILWRNSSGSESMDSDWDQCYENSRRLAVQVFYSDAYARTNKLYEGFIAMLILFNCIQQMQTKYLKTDTNREFYDNESIKLIYDSYGIPFYSEIPLEYHRKIIKRINHLLSKKGSDNLFIALFEIFDFGTMALYNYFFAGKKPFC